MHHLGRRHQPVSAASDREFLVPVVVAARQPVARGISRHALVPHSEDEPSTTQIDIPGAVGTVLCV